MIIKLKQTEDCCVLVESLQSVDNLVSFHLHILPQSWSLKLSLWVFSIWLGFNLTQTEATIHISRFTLSHSFGIAFEYTPLTSPNTTMASQPKHKTVGGIGLQLIKSWTEKVTETFAIVSKRITFFFCMKMCCELSGNFKCFCRSIAIYWLW